MEKSMGTREGNILDRSDWQERGIAQLFEMCVFNYSFTYWEIIAIYGLYKAR